MRTRERPSLILKVTTAFAAIVLQSARLLASPSYSIERLGLFDNGYTSNVNGEIQASSYIAQLNDAGEVLGASARYSGNGEDLLGTDSWLFNGTATQQIGFFGSGYGYNDASQGGFWEQSTPLQLNSLGEALGYSTRYAPDGTPLGQDSWLFDGTTTRQVGFTGSNYSYNYVGEGVYQFSTPVQLNQAGQMLGSSNRYSATGVGLGQDIWLSNGTTTSQIELTGSGYSYTTSNGVYEYSTPVQLNDFGEVIGWSTAYSTGGLALGTVSWLFNSTSIQQIGLTGANYSYTTSNGVVQNSAPQLLNNAGEVAGVSQRQIAGLLLGQDTWFFNGTTTTQIGLTGVGYSYSMFGRIEESSSLRQMNQAGQVVGYSLRNDASGKQQGQDSWLFNGTKTEPIGLTGTGYSYTNGSGVYEYNSAQQLNESGEVIGYSSRYSSTGTSLGSDSWIFNGTTTQQIGLIGAGYSYNNANGTYEKNTSVQMNDSGQVIGTALRYNSSGSSLGLDGWLFDPAQNKTFLISSGVFSVYGQSNTIPELLTSNGDVLGYYELYNGNQDEGAQAFEWSEMGGFVDLGSLVNGGLTAQDWQAIGSPSYSAGTQPDSFPTYIAGDGSVINGLGVANYLLTESVPEPTSAALILFSSATLLVSRRYRS